MSYRLGRPADRSRLTEMLNAAIQFLADQGIDQWQNASVSITDLDQAIADQEAYVWEDSNGQVQAFWVLAAHDPYYQTLSSGTWRSTGPYLAIRRFMVAKESKGQGLAQQIFKAIEEISRDQGVNTLRIDTHPDNQIMQHLILKAGFSLTGETVVGDGGRRLTYDKLLDR